MSYFHDVRGASYGTHVLAHVPASQHAIYRNRKGTLSQNVLAGCGLDMYLFYVCPAREGSADDAWVLENGEQNRFPREEGAIYLADAGYGLRKGFLTPYRTVQYHLREQARAGLCPQTKEELWNLHHSQLRNVIERIFGVLRRRFRILNTTPEYNLTIQAQLILVVCALHNFIGHRANGEEDGFYQGSNLPSQKDSESLHSEEEIQAASGLEQGSGQGSDIGEMVVDRERRATEMWIDYVKYHNSRM